MCLLNAYFFVWNPQKDPESFSKFEKIIADSKLGKPYRRRWICPSRQPQPGDQAFLQRTGPKDNGVFAKGTVTSAQYMRNDGVLAVDLSLTSLLRIGFEIPRDDIKERAKIGYNWAPMASGNVIPSEILAAIEELWAERSSAQDKGAKTQSLTQRRTHSGNSVSSTPRTSKPDYPNDMKSIRKAISVRQPWAWLIVNGHKDIENRSWATKYRGRLWIHAGGHRVTRPEYEDFVETCRARRIRTYPGIEEFETGGIVGSVEIVDCVTESRSPWFGGEYGFVLKNAQKSPFQALSGKLGIFAV